MATVQGIYVALFGRPADPAGLAHFNEATQNGSDLTAIGDLTATAEYQKRFAGQTDSEVISSIFQGLFERDPEAAGLSFYLGGLADGSMTINSIAVDILNGAQGLDLAIAAANIEAADQFTFWLTSGKEHNAYAGHAATHFDLEIEAVAVTPEDGFPTPQDFPYEGLVGLPPPMYYE